MGFGELDEALGVLVVGIAFWAGQQYEQFTYKSNNTTIIFLFLMSDGINEKLYGSGWIDIVNLLLCLPISN